MKVKEYKNKIVINELNPSQRYICLVNPDLVRMESLPKSKYIWYVLVFDVDKAVRFIGVPKKKWWEFWK